MKIILVADSEGFELKEAAKAALDEFGIKHDDLGSSGDVEDVYHACKAVVEDGYDYAFGFTLRGQNMACLANKMGGVVAHVVYNAAVAYRAVAVEANFLSFSAQTIHKGFFDVDQSIRSIIKNIAEMQEK